MDTRGETSQGYHRYILDTERRDISVTTPTGVVQRVSEPRVRFFRAFSVLRKLHRYETAW